MAAHVQSPVTDSPWFWVLMFSGMALAALLAIGPKYGGRQARLERQYQARERIAADRKNSETELARTNHQADPDDYASSEETLIPLWPLAVVLSAIVIFAALMLFRGQTIAARRCPRPGSLVDEGPP